MEETGNEVWQASEARSHFSEVMDRALTGVPQVIRRRPGEEVVVLSRSDYDALRPTLKDVLLRGGPVPADDNTLEEIIAENRRRGLTMMGRISVGE